MEVEFAKHLDYTLRHEAMTEAHARHVFKGEFTAEYIENMMAIVKSRCIKTCYKRFGSQMYVEKDVTDDLRYTDIEVMPSDLEFPDRCMEFYFEDPELPTILMFRGTPEELLKPLPIFEQFVHKGDRSLPGLFFSSAVLKPTKMLLLDHVLEQNWGDWMAGLGDSLRVTLGGYQTGDMELTDLSMSPYYELCLKVLFYAAIPRYMEKQGLRKRPKDQKGKPGINGRPRRPVNRVIYLPEVKQLKVRQIAEEVGKQRKHKFRGRRGSIRTFRSDRYSPEIRGTSRYFPPIPGPDGTIPKRKYVVREPVKKVSQ